MLLGTHIYEVGVVRQGTRVCAAGNLDLRIVEFCGREPRYTELGLCSREPINIQSRVCAAGNLDIQCRVVCSREPIYTE